MVDNVSRNNVVLDKLRDNKIGNWDSSVLNGESLHLRCVAYILNLIVKDGLRIFNESIVRVRNAVKYVRYSPTRESLFIECANYIWENKNSKSLILHVDTRWNLTYKMLDVAEPSIQTEFETWVTQ